MNSSNYNMNSSNSKSSSTTKDRRRTLMACTNCRSRKLKCRPLESDSASCERCSKDGNICEYRPVDSGSASNGYASNYPDQDNTVNLYYCVQSAPPPNQELSLPEIPSSYAHTQGGYVPNQTFNPAMQAPGPSQTNAHYSMTPFQPQQSSSYPVTQYSYHNTFPSEFPADQSNYQSTSQFGGHPQYMSYPHAHGQENGPYDQRDYQFNGYENNMDGSNS